MTRKRETGARRAKRSVRRRNLRSKRGIKAAEREAKRIVGRVEA